MKTKVTFADTTKIFTTFSSDEYDRTSIDHVLYRKAYNRVSDEEWNNMYITLDLYKLYDMKTHKDSFHNNLYHAKKLVNFN